MARTISEQNLRSLVDLLVKEGNRVVGPKSSGKLTLYEPLAAGEELVTDVLPARSLKEAFFPLCETILSFRKGEAGAQVEDADLSRLPETVVVAARPCDAAAAPVLDPLFSWGYDDPFYLERRKKTTVIGLACSSCDSACFCTAVGLSPDSRQGSDLFLTPAQGGGYIAEAVTEGGERLLSRHAALFAEAGAAPAALAVPDAAAVDLGKVRKWLEENFESDFWNETATRCAGCGACAFVCPACHCFDIVDEGSEKEGVRRKFWDACGFAKFTDHASGHNPRDAQGKRYRNRVMHKFRYYPEKFGKTLCTGCGRCARACPVGIDVKEVIDGIEEKAGKQ